MVPVVDNSHDQPLANTQEEATNGISAYHTAFQICFFDSGSDAPPAPLVLLAQWHSAAVLSSTPTSSTIARNLNCFIC